MTQESFSTTLFELEEMARVQRATRGIDGWLSDLEGAALYHAAAYGPSEGAIVEIGSFKGKSTIWLANGSERTGREQVHAIDTHLGSPEHQAGGEFSSHMPAEGTTEAVFRKNIAKSGVENRVVPLVMSSAVALSSWQEPIRLLFIDGAHEYEDVKADFIGWHKHVVSGGLIAFHDVDQWDGFTELDGPSRVVHKDVLRTGDYSYPTIVNHLAFVTKN